MNKTSGVPLPTSVRRPGLSLPTLAAALLALTIAAGLGAASVSARGGLTGTCLASPQLPCSASDGQTYGSTTLPDGNDSEASMEAVLGHVKGEPVDLSPVAVDLHGDTGDFDFTNPDAAGDETFSWEYSGQAPLAYLAVTSDQGGFAIYDVFSKRHGSVDVEPLLGPGFEHVDHFSFWQRTYSECEPVRVEDQHGKGMIPGCQLAEIVDGKVPCVHVSKEKASLCKFRTGRHSSGKWLEGIERGKHAKFGMGGQAITKKGKRGGPWVVASKTTHDAGIPCKKPPPGDPPKRERSRLKRDTASVAADGTLPASGYTEVSTATTNVHAPLVNFATREVCANTPPPHPDGATLSSHVPGSSVWCYTGAGAGMNDPNGTERYPPAQGGLYIDDAQHRHFINYLGSTVAAAKRPSVKPNGEILTGSPIAWRVVAPSAKIAN
jgi:hypothetical protein